jgi:hypothetical protein
VDWVQLAVGCCEHGSGTIGRGEYIDGLSDYHLLKDENVRSNGSIVARIFNLDTRWK